MGRQTKGIKKFEKLLKKRWNAKDPPWIAELTP
jgi:hypothetical protein